MFEIRTEQIWIKSTPEISNQCHLRKNLYNQANYLIKHPEAQTITINPKTNKPYNRYEMLNANLCNSENYVLSQSSQQTLMIVDKDWTSFFESLKDWKVHPEKYKTKPRSPHYKPKDGETLAVFTNQQCMIRDGYLTFPKKMSSMRIKTRIKSLNQVRIVPKGTGYVCEIIYEKRLSEKQLINRRWYSKLKRKGIVGIDYGSVNIVTMGDNIGSVPIVIKDNGKGIKSINQFYNKKKAWLQSIYEKRGIKFGPAMSRLNDKRSRKIKDQMHKLSRFIVDCCVENDVETIAIGHNEGWKQNINIGKRNNQNFVGIPFNTLTKMITYKAEEYGIIVKVPEEDHTSKCSFLDLEPIEHRDSYLGRRIKRGLFRSSNGTLINADCNGMYNIIRRSEPKAFDADGVGGCVLHPKRVSHEGVCY
jgi:putative transposase